MNNQIMVSIICTAYNHEKYIQQALDGFLMQKTDFRYEVLVHDDASLDGTADIIRRYAEKYPDTIIPIIQTENQYSKGVKICKTIVRNGIKPVFCDIDPDSLTINAKKDRGAHY